MKRKHFIQYAGPAAALPLLAGELALQSCYRQIKHRPAGKVLVVVQLDGGNDGLNAVIPLSEYKNMSAARSNILIPENRVLKLNHTEATGFHPAMQGLQSLYNSGLLTVIQGVGYPSPVLSHFRSIDIWHSASGAHQLVNTGWLGRYLHHRFPGFPVGYPSTGSPHPPAVQVGALLSNALQGPVTGMGMAVQDVANFYPLHLKQQVADPTTPMGHELAFINITAAETKGYLKAIRETALAQKNLSALYPAAGKNPLADQLRIVAQLIGGGLETSVYMVSLNEFDTHYSQTDVSDTTKGKHAYLLQLFSDAVTAFVDDLQQMGKADEVLGMAFSEFGRRIKSNDGAGTDHGTAGPVFLFGTQLKHRLLGTNPLIPPQASVDDNLDMQFDFRAVYASVLSGWLNADAALLPQIIPGQYPLLPLFT